MINFMRCYKLTIIIFLFQFTILLAQPEPTVRFCAEWEPAKGTLIRYPLGIPHQLVNVLAQDDSLYILVQDQQEEELAIESFINHGVNIDHCRFFHIPTNSHWTRDWGPQFLFDGNDEMAILDPEFDGYPWVPGGRPYDYDDAVNAALGEYLDCDVYYLPAYLTGGNIMTDGNGNAFSTQQMLDENINLGINNLEFYSLLEEYAGITDYRIVSNIEDYGIQHIDCGAKLLSEEKVLIKRLPEWHPEYYRMEDVAREFDDLQTCFGNNYEIIRIDCPAYSGNECAAYTNSLILNNKVFVPLFGIDGDAEAIEVYENAMPGYEIFGVYYDLWFYYDALHCRTHEIMDPDMLYLFHEPANPLQPSGQQIELHIKIKAYSGAAIDLSHSFLFWSTPNSTFNFANIQQTAMQDTFYAVIPPQESGTEIQYYWHIEDESPREEILPRGAPWELYSFNVDESAENDDHLIETKNIVVSPNPFNPATTITFNCQPDYEYSIEIFNIKGNRVLNKKVVHSTSGTFSYRWNGKNSEQRDVSSGVYIIMLKENGIINDSARCVLIK